MFGLTSCFLLSRNKNTENEFSNVNAFLDLLKITFLAIAFLFYPKWGFWFQLKTLKMRFYCFQFLVRLRKYFHWKCFQKSNQTHFHHYFLFPVKMKTKTDKPNTPLCSRSWVSKGRRSWWVGWLKYRWKGRWKGKTVFSHVSRAQ